MPPIRQRRSNEDIRQHLLDAAELLFAEHGFHGVAVRTITEAAGCRVADINEHLGSKEALFREVVRRRADVINAEREAALQALPQQGPQRTRLRAWVAAFAHPWLTHAQEGPGWQAYLRLVAQTNVSRAPVLAWVADLFNPIALRFMAELQAICPQASPQQILHAYQFMLSAALSAFAANCRVDVLSHNRFRSDDFARQYEDMLVFVTAGLQALLSHRPG